MAPEKLTPERISEIQDNLNYMTERDALNEAIRINREDIADLTAKLNSPLLGELLAGAGEVPNLNITGLTRAQSILLIGVLVRHIQTMFKAGPNATDAEKFKAARDWFLTDQPDPAITLESCRGLLYLLKQEGIDSIASERRIIRSVHWQKQKREQNFLNSKNMPLGDTSTDDVPPSNS